MELSCSGLQDFSREGEIYTCTVGDSNYLFRKCTGLILETSKDTILPHINKVIKDIHFEYVIDGETIIGDNISPSFG